MGKFLRYAAIGAAALFFIAVSDRAADYTDESTLEQTEQSVMNAAVRCYALEGAYPPSLDYLIENYGIFPDTEKYMVDYKCFASNIPPSITVLPKDLGG